MKKVRKCEWWDRYAKPKQAALLAFLAIFVLILILYFLSWQSDKRTFRKYWKSEYDFDSPVYRDKDAKFEGEKIVHLDLKGAPPKIAYFEKLFPLLAILGASGLLIEYEDMFPYEGQLLRNISAANSYTPEDIRTIVRLAEESRLSVIPLVQTFGHLEFMLKLKQFEDLREVPEYPQVICPTHEDTINLIMDMVDQIIRAHPSATKIHIGADEVWFVGVCDRCVNLMSKFGWTKSQLFLEHVTAVAQKIQNRYPHIRILMWDDQFRSMTYKELKSSHISSLIEPVVWKYSKNVYDDLGPSLWDLYAEVFPKIWIASAFKGATGSNQYMTDVTHHLQNHRSWMSIISEYKGRIKFQGIFITGWQRYDHFAILCELLPVAIPSLAMSLRLLLGYNESPLSPPTEVARLLQCEQPYGLIGPTFGLPKCLYPGGEVLDIMLRFHQLQEEYSHMMEDSRIRGWMSDYNIDHGFSNPQYVESGTAPLSGLRIELSQLEADLHAAMQEVYDNHTLMEWSETYLKPFSVNIKKLWDAREILLSKRHWERRPFSGGYASDL